MAVGARLWMHPDTQVCPLWKPTSVQLGSPYLSTEGVQLCPQWLPMLAHVGSPHRSTMGVQTRPSWKPISVYGGRPLLPTLVVHTTPQWASKPTQVGSQILVGGRPEAAKVGQPILALGYPHAKSGYPKRTRQPSTNSGHQLAQVATLHARKWMLMPSGGHPPPKCGRP